MDPTRSPPASDGAGLRMSAFAFADQPADSSNDAQFSAFSALQAPAPIPFNPLAAVLAIPGEVVKIGRAHV